MFIRREVLLPPALLKVVALEVVIQETAEKAAAAALLSVRREVWVALVVVAVRDAARAAAEVVFPD